MSEKPKKARGLYPKYSLLETLKIAESIRDNNNMQPYNRLNLAKSLNTTPSSSAFRLLITSSTAYGLTTGSYSAEKLSLTTLGKSVVAYKSDAERRVSLQRALFNIPKFRDFYTNFDGGNLPRKDLLMNTLHRDYGIPLANCEDCYKIIMQNAKELRLTTNIKGKDYLQLSNLTVVSESDSFAQEPDSEIQDISEKDETVVDYRPEDRLQFQPTVFISHSKNSRILDQIEQILEFGQFEYRVAAETETTAIPISEKVFGSMRECNCAIINVSVDEADPESYQVNQNVLTEIGAAFLNYNKKVILLVDKRIVDRLPSNLDGLYRCEYKGDELDFETSIKLQKALSGFRKE